MPTAILALVVAVLSGLTVDGVRAAQATASADAIAAEAARAGGQAVDTAALARGNPQIDPAAAVAAARSYLAAAHAEGTAVVEGRTITVSVTLTRPTVLSGWSDGDDHQPRCRPGTARPGRCAMRSAVSPAGASVRAVVRAIASLAGIVAILVGIPILLWQLGTPLLPSRVPSLHEAVAVFLRPDDGSLLMGTLLAIGVLVWAQLSVSILAELVAALRHRPGLRVELPGLGASRLLASVLVAGVLGAGGAGPALAAEPIAAIVTVDHRPQTRRPPARHHRFVPHATRAAALRGAGAGLAVADRGSPAG